MTERRRWGRGAFRDAGEHASCRIGSGRSPPLERLIDPPRDRYHRTRLRSNLLFVDDPLSPSGRVGSPGRIESGGLIVESEVSLLGQPIRTVRPEPRNHTLAAGARSSASAACRSNPSSAGSIPTTSTTARARRLCLSAPPVRERPGRSGRFHLRNGAGVELAH
jgi:hypothetical protein